MPSEDAGGKKPGRKLLFFGALWQQIPFVFLERCEQPVDTAPLCDTPNGGPRLVQVGPLRLGRDSKCLASPVRPVAPILRAETRHARFSVLNRWRPEPIPAPRRSTSPRPPGAT